MADEKDYRDEVVMESLGVVDEDDSGYETADDEENAIAEGYR